MYSRVTVRAKFKMLSCLLLIIIENIRIFKKYKVNVHFK